MKVPTNLKKSPHSCSHVLDATQYSKCEKEMDVQVGAMGECLYSNGDYYECIIEERNENLFNIKWLDGDKKERKKHPESHFRKMLSLEETLEKKRGREEKRRKEREEKREKMKLQQESLKRKKREDDIVHNAKRKRSKIMELSHARDECVEKIHTNAKNMHLTKFIIL